MYYNLLMEGPTSYSEFALDARPVLGCLWTRTKHGEVMRGFRDEILFLLGRLPCERLQLPIIERSGVAFDRLGRDAESIAECQYRLETRGL